MVYILLLLMDLKNIELSLIVGINKKRGIGLNGTMPWYFPEDLKYFQRLTKTTIDPNKKNIVLMGRNTMNSIPKFPLKNRINVYVNEINDLKNSITNSIKKGFSEFGKGNNIFSRVSNGAKNLFTKSRDFLKNKKNLDSIILLLNLKAFM
mgnify:CR=1 FL=1